MCLAAAQLGAPRTPSFSQRPAQARPVAPLARPPAPRLCRHRRVATAAAADDSEVAVFRFTLGSDAADALVPRVVGTAGAALLLLNHLLGGQEPSEAQLRAEALGAALAAASFATPSIEARLKELQPGRGRQAAASAVEGATSVFALHPSLPDATKQELAWASYALLRNANICGLAVFWDGRAVLARGLLGAAALGAAGSGGKRDASEALTALGDSAPAPATAAWQQGAVYCPDKAAVGKIASGWPCVPAGAESLLVQPLLPFSGGGDGSSSGGTARGVLVLLSERPRALSSKERAWAAAVAAKLHGALLA